MNAINVTGGTTGLEAKYDDLLGLASRGDALAGALMSVSVKGHAMLVDPNLLASGVLNPAGLARVEALLLRALDGPDGVTVIAASFSARSIQIRCAAATYDATDWMLAQGRDLSNWFKGVGLQTAAVAGTGAVLAGQPELALPIGWAALSLFLSPPEQAELAFYLASGLGWQRWLTDHPGVVDELVGSSPGLLGLAPGAVPGAAGLVALLYRDGVATVHDRPGGTPDEFTVTRDLQSGRPRGRVERLMQGLAKTDGDSIYQDDVGNEVGTDGTIRVRTITHEGKTVYMVDLPGTKQWNLPAEGRLNDLGTNLQAMSGQPSAYERGVAKALERAGAPRGAEVMLVGHSQGGIVAMQAAHDSGTDVFPYRVTHVVTAGAPVGRIQVDDSIRVLSIENAHDIVPHLDAADNPQTHNRTTVTFDRQGGAIGTNHGMEESYVGAGQEIDGAKDPAVQAFLDSAEAYLAPPGADHTVTDVEYQLKRQ